MKFNLERIKDVVNLTRQLAVGLRDITFEDNFKGFKEVDLVIPATSEVRLRNLLKLMPSGYIITSQEGKGQVTKSTTLWTDEFVYLYNHGSVEVTITIQFLK